VHLRVQRGGTDLRLFEGIIRTVQYHPQRTRLICVTPAAKWDLTSHTRSFTSIDGAPVALHLLPGFQAAFPGIKGLNRLTAQSKRATGAFFAVSVLASACFCLCEAVRLNWQQSRPATPRNWPMPIWCRMTRK
jgi:hypothetical protein